MAASISCRRITLVNLNRLFSPFASQDVLKSVIEVKHDRKLSTFPKQGIYSPFDLIESTKKSEGGPTEQHSSSEVLQKVNTNIVNQDYGRLFAVVSVTGKQFKVTQDDLIMFQQDFPGNVGSEIILDKVLMLGSSSFTAIGRPLLDKEQVKVGATVVEKTFSQQIMHFRSEKRSDFRRMHCKYSG